MATYIVLLSFADQGIRNVKDSPDRFDAFRGLAEKLGVTVKSGYWTIGSFDMVVTIEGSEESVTVALLKLGSLGNIRSQTLRGFSADEMRQMIGKMP